MGAFLNEVLKTTGLGGILVYASYADILSQTDFESIFQGLDNPRKIPVRALLRGPMVKRWQMPGPVLAKILAEIPETGAKIPENIRFFPPPAPDFHFVSSALQSMDALPFLLTAGGCGGALEAAGTPKDCYRLSHTRFNDLQITMGAEPLAAQALAADFAAQSTGEKRNAAALTCYENSIIKDLAPEFGDQVNTTMINKDLTVNLEELTGSEADLVLYWDSQADEAAQVNKMGIPAFCVHSAKDMATLKELVAMLGDVLNCPQQAERILAWYDEAEARMHTKDDEVNKLTDDQKPKVLQMRTMDDLKIYYKGVNRTFIEQVGGRAIDLTGTSAESSTPTMEEIYAFNPDILLLSNWDSYTPEDLYENRIEGQDWSGVNAVINHRVYKVPLGLYRWTPPNCTEKPLYWYYLASIIQPEIFSDIDLRQEVSDFFVRFFDYQLTDAQIDSILHTELNALSE